jgi:hypothetical protein
MILLPMLSSVNLLWPVAVLFLAAALLVYNGGRPILASRLQS